MFYGFTKFIYDRLPYFRYHDADTNHTGTEGRAAEEARTGESGEGGKAGGEEGSTSIKIGEECKLEGVESVDTYTSPTPRSTANSPRAHGSSHITVAGNHYYRTGELLAYNERSGECTVVDCHGNLVTIHTAANPFKNHTR
jgi:hypothetical protein